MHSSWKLKFHHPSALLTDEGHSATEGERHARELLQPIRQQIKNNALTACKKWWRTTKQGVITSSRNSTEILNDFFAHIILTERDYLVFFTESACDVHFDSSVNFDPCGWVSSSWIQWKAMTQKKEWPTLCYRMSSPRWMEGIWRGSPRWKVLLMFEDIFPLRPQNSQFLKH